MRLIKVSAPQEMGARVAACTTSLAIVQFPYFDFNYGWGPRIQLKLEAGWVTVGALDAIELGSETSGASTALIGVKYRFLDEETARRSMS